MGFKEFNRGLSSAEVRKNAVDQRAKDEAREIQALWLESERILDILRAISPIKQELNQATIARWKASLRKPALSRQSSEAFHIGEPQKLSPTHPVQWFEDRFPRLHVNWGPAFFGNDQRNTITPGSIFVPEAINTDFFAGIVGGSDILGHQVVFHGSEDQFYFYDPRVDAYRPTSEGKLHLLLSNYLVKCAQDCRQRADTSNLTGAFREPETLKNVILRAKSMHESDKSFFTGKNGKMRLVDGKLIDPATVPSHERFVTEALQVEPEARLTINDAFDRYLAYCGAKTLPPASRIEFKNMVPGVIRERFNLGIRHDLKTAEDKLTHGWRGLSCSVDFSQN